MKTLFLVSPRFVNKHAGEEYDAILEVEHQPTVETIGDWHNRVRGRIRSLWKEQEQEVAVVNPVVKVFIDAAPPFIAMIRNLQIIMKSEEGIVIEIPGLDGVKREITDRETLEVLKKLEERNA